MRIEQAVILAGGQGKRLRPFTLTNNKVMYPINGKPFLWHLAKLLKKNGIKEILVLTGYRARKVYIKFPGVKINYHYTPFKIKGKEIQSNIRIKNAFNLLDNYFLLLYCDNWWPLNLQELILYPGNLTYNAKDLGFWRVPKAVLLSGANIPIERYLEQILSLSIKTDQRYYSISDPARAEETARYLNEM